MIHIIGAGFTGLTLAWELQKAGLSVKLYEKNQIGGLLQTTITPTHLRESAANGLLWTPRLEQLAKELQVDFLPSQQASKKRFIFREGKPQRWPLNVFETFCLITNLVKFIFKKIVFKTKVDSKISLSEWGYKNFGQKFTDFVLTAAVRGIYALPATKLNAKAILDSFSAVTKFKKAKRYKPTTYAPKLGMGQLMAALQQKVSVSRTEITQLHELKLSDKDAVVIATSAWDAAKILPDIHLQNIEAVPLLSVTLVWPKDEPTLNGFGCLFPPNESFFAAGVLVNGCIFEGRGPNPTETWIMSQDPAGLSDDQIKQSILSDRQRLFKTSNAVLECHITRWPKAIPAYNLELENFLLNYTETTEKKLANKNIYLAGNYLGKIGLAKIYDQNIVLAEKLKAKYA
ncbi:hypothetical protein CIK05_10150 [Bdellovibrio sp. qaytius]|nr:hypothetical protein CIK05_10150 [Bdellovibrio sp. qaytius]